MHIVNIENGVVSAEGDGTLTFRAGKIRVVLGEYSSAQKAFKVLDMIQEAYEDEKVVLSSGCCHCSIFQRNRNSLCSLL